ncbi:hypothetical protein [Microbacterium sp. zg-YB36]|uniref:hypothetical protein n=1 Tax=Microbacterium sp. zg-YB36 TaxID=2969407 RepID=UPI00214B9E87|nr:hypothetical protein [Microbacterium sp. zg-YB36]MDL5350941.1 hypothetical protein [Microbacterium sp. zg-YB36]
MSASDIPRWIDEDGARPETITVLGPSNMGTKRAQQWLAERDFPDALVNAPRVAGGQPVT